MRPTIRDVSIRTVKAYEKYNAYTIARFNEYQCEPVRCNRQTVDYETTDANPSKSIVKLHTYVYNTRLLLSRFPWDTDITSTQYPRVPRTSAHRNVPRRLYEDRKYPSDNGYEAVAAAVRSFRIMLIRSTSPPRPL